MSKVKYVKQKTTENLWLSGVSWFMAILVFVFRLLRLGDLWAATGYLWFIYTWLPFLRVILSLLELWAEDVHGERKIYLKTNAIILAVTVSVILFTISVSC